MATLMQKDVLIEYVAGADALIRRVLDNHEYEGHTKEISKEEWFLSRLKDELYGLKPEDIDYQGLVDQVKPIYEKYQPIAEKLFEQKEALAG